jgi:hypothetical protein
LQEKKLMVTDYEIVYTVKFTVLVSAENLAEAMEAAEEGYPELVDFYNGDVQGATVVKTDTALGEEEKGELKFSNGEGWVEL